MHSRSILSGLALVCAGFLSTPAAATTVSGRVTASAYAFEGNSTASDAATYVRSHAALRLQVSDLGHRALSLTSYLQGTTDLLESADTDPATRFYSLFLRYKDRHADVRLGRQWISVGVGAGTMDGARLDLKRYGVGLTLYGGALAPVDGYARGQLDEAHLYGVRLQTSQLAGILIAVSYADRERDPIAYVNPGRYSGFVGQPQAIRRQLAGIEASRRFGLHSLRSRVDYDVQNESLRRGEIAGRVGLSPDLALQASWRHRQPSVYSGSIFSVFPSEGYDEYALRLFYRVSDALSLSTHAATVQYDDDSTQRLGLSASWGRHLTLGYRHYQGYAGGANGLSGSVLYDLSPQLTFRGDLDLSTYERFDAEDSDGLVAASAGLTWRATREFSLDGQLQGLRNPSYDTDLRGLLRGSWRFRR